MIHRLASALLSFTCLVGLSFNMGGVVKAEPPQFNSPVRMTLAEFARTRARAAHSSTAGYAPRAWLAPQAISALRGRFANAYLLYASAADPSGTGGFINIYPGWVRSAHPPLLGQVTGLDSPSGIAIDSHGTLYVCQTDPGAPVLVFPLGATRPSLELKTLGNEPVAVAVSPAGTVFVSTPNANGLSAKILVYAPGRTMPAKSFENLAADAVGALQTDEHGNVYFAGDFVGFGNYIGEISTAGVERSLLSFDSPVLGLELDRSGNILAQQYSLGIYAHDSGHLLRTLSVAGFQSLSFNPTESGFYSGGGAIEEYAYPSGALLNTITSLTAYNTFGLATFPAAPHGLPW